MSLNETSALQSKLSNAAAFGVASIFLTRQKAGSFVYNLCAVKQ